MNRHDSKKLPRLLPMLIALVCLFCALSGTASAAETVIAVGGEWAEGDVLIVHEDVYASGAYIINDTWLYDNYGWDDTISCLAPGRYTVSGLSNTNSATSTNGNGTCRLGWVDIYVPHGGRTETPIAFRVAGGSGTKADPYVPDFVYPTTDGFSVAFNGGQGSTGTMQPVADVSGEYELPACGFYAPTGKEFAGWKVNNTGDLLQPGSTIQVTANITLYAQWTMVDYTLTVSNGTATFNGVTASSLTGLHYGDTVSITAAAPEAGKAFDQWNTNHAGTFGNRYEATTTFTMPARNESIWVRYKDAIETCSHHDGEIVCYAWDGNAPLPDTAGSYFLTQDVVLTSPWEVPQGLTSLCLHEHKITMAGDGPAIHVGNGATLLLLASNQNWSFEGNTLQHAEGADGCGVQVDGGSFQLEIARIISNEGGGIVVNSGSVKLTNRCAILNNGSAAALGGGVQINGGSVLFDGGYFRNNTALAGGGVYVNGGTFTACLGELNNGNTAALGSDVYVASGEFCIYDRPSIGSVYLASGQKITVTGTLNYTYAMTVEMQDHSGIITSGLKNRGSIARFAAADENHQIIEGAGSEAFLLFTPPAFGEPDFILPADITAIGESAFEGNASMAVVYVPGESASIGKDAFKNCSGLLQIRLPKDCTFDGNPFDGCTNLMAIYASEGGYTQTWAQNNGIPFSTAVDQNP